MIGESWPATVVAELKRQRSERAVTRFDVAWRRAMLAFPPPGTWRSVEPFFRRQCKRAWQGEGRDLRHAASALVATNDDDRSPGVTVRRASARAPLSAA